MHPDGSPRSTWSLWAVGGLMVAYVGLLSWLGSQMPVLRPPPPVPVPRPRNMPEMTCADVGASNVGSPVLSRRDIFHWEAAPSGHPPSGTAPSDEARPPMESLPDAASPTAWVLIGILQADGPPVSVWQSGSDTRILMEGDLLGDGVRIRSIHPDGVVLTLPRGASRRLQVGEAFRLEGDGVTSNNSKARKN
jgi:hypothetical protein